MKQTSRICPTWRHLRVLEVISVCYPSETVKRLYKVSLRTRQFWRCLRGVTDGNDLPGKEQK